MRYILLVSTTLCLIGTARAQGYDQSVADMIMAAQQQQVPGGECYTPANGPCNGGLVPITFQPGDVVLSGSITDGQGNVWSLQPDSCNGNPPGTWWSGLYENGQQISCGYGVALRNVNGTVWYEEAKGSGWRPATQNNGLAGPYVTNPGQGTSSGTQTTTAAPAPAAATTPPPAADPVNLAPFADPSCPTQTFSWSSAVPGAATPGSGSFTDGSGNTYTVDAGNSDVAAVNGSPINQWAYQTSQLVMGSDGQIYGQSNAPDNNGQWFTLSSDGTYWQPLTTATPPAIMPASAEGVSQQTGAPLNTQQTFSQQYGYFEATVAPGGLFALVPAGTTNGGIEVGLANDGASHVYGASVTKDGTTLYTDAVQVSQSSGATMLPLYLVGTGVMSARAFPNMADALACVSQVEASAPATPPAVLPTTSLPPAVMPADGSTITGQLAAVQAQITATRQSLGSSISLGQNWQVTPGANVTQNTDGSVTIAGGGNSYNDQMSTTQSVTGAATFSATVSFAGTPTTNGGWPAVWVLPTDAAAAANPTSTELDIMEVMGTGGTGHALHDWQGDGSPNAISTNIPVTPPIDYSQPHTYSASLVPATATSQGSVTWSIDGQQVGQQTFSQGSTYSDLSTEPHQFILGSGPNNPMTVYSASVTQP